VLLLYGARSGCICQDKSYAPPRCPAILPRNPADSFGGLDGAIGRHEHERLLHAFAGPRANDLHAVCLPVGYERYPTAHDAAPDNQVRIDQRAGSVSTTAEQPVCAAQSFTLFGKRSDVLQVGWHGRAREAGNVGAADAGQCPTSETMLPLVPLRMAVQL